MVKPLFQRGCILMAIGALALLNANQVNPAEVLCRHVTGDWGDLDDKDKAENNYALRRGRRIFSACMLPEGSEIWVITEADRTVTTLLLPDEY